jgi:hypothetical protein
MKRFLCFALMGLLLTASHLAQPATPMRKLTHDVRLGPHQLTRLEAVTIESSVELIADQCTITLPSRVLNKSLELERKVKRGDRVVVSLGYDGVLREEFTGYVRAIHATTPMRIECEDSAYLLRRDVADKQWKGVDTPVIIQYVLEQVNRSLPPDQQLTLTSDVQGVLFDSFSIIGSNGYAVLEKLKQETGLAIYCKGAMVHCHLRYTERRGEAQYDFSRNVKRSDSLEFVRADDVKVSVRIVGRGKKAKAEATAGQAGGDVQTLYRPTIGDQATLDRVAEEELKKLSYDGFRGSLRGFLMPVVEPGYSARLYDPENGERSGAYYVKAVTTEFSPAGGQRTVTLGQRLSV